MQEEIQKYRLKVTKTKELSYISHLDWQNLILKIFRRCNLKLVLSECFSKMPKVSYSPALPIFLESECELINFQTKEKLKDTFLQDFKKNSPEGIEIISLKEISEDMLKKEPKSLENLLQWAEYSAEFDFEKNHVYNFEKIRYIINKCLSSDEFLITKKTKKGIDKTVNYRNSLKSLEFKDDKLVFILKTGQNDVISALRADEFLRILFPQMENFKIKRTKFFDNELEVI